MLAYRQVIGILALTCAAAGAPAYAQSKLEAHYTATTIGGTTVYDLTATTSSTSSS